MSLLIQEHIAEKEKILQRTTQKLKIILNQNTEKKGFVRLHID